MLQVAFPIYDGAEELDFAGPWEALALARDYGKQDLELFAVGESLDPVRMRGGLRALPDRSFASTPAVDLIVVPGGPGTRNETASTPVVDWLRRIGPDTSLVTSVCTGSFLLARAGLLDGRSATTHHARLDQLKQEFPHVHVVRGMRLVDQVDVVTAGGVTAGIDLGLHLVERFFGLNLSNRVAEVIEYQPRTVP